MQQLGGGKLPDHLSGGVDVVKDDSDESECGSVYSMPASDGDGVDGASAAAFELEEAQVAVREPQLGPHAALLG